MLLTTERKAKARSFEDVIAALDARGFGSMSGATVSSDSAMRQATVWACVRILSEIIAQLPIMVQIRQGAQWVESEEHEALALLAEPNPWMTQHDLVSHLVSWSELIGNGYLFKNRARGKVLRLLPIRGNQVDVEQRPDWSIKYYVGTETGESGEFGPDKVFHLRNFGNDGYMGLSTIGNMREGIGLALKLEEHGARQFKNGLSAAKWIKSDKTMTPDTMNQLKDALAGYESAENAGKTLILQGGLELHAVDMMSAADAQYLESRRFQKQDIASIFGVPLFLLNDTEKSTTWGSGLEQLSRSFVRFSLNPRLNRLSQTLNRELIDPNSRRQVRFMFDTDGFQLGEFKERMDGYRSAIEAGVLNPNECREIEGRNPRDGGDDYRQPVNIAVEGQPDEVQAPDPPV